MHQAVDAGGQADEHAEVGDRLDGALDAVAALHGGRELFPRIGLALLHAQADAALVFVDLEDHDFDFIAQRDDLAGGDVLVGPVHFGDVHQAFDARLDLDERAVVGDVRDLAEQARAVRVAARDAMPRVVAQLLDAQRDAVLLGVELQDLGLQLLADLDHFARVTHTAPGHVGDVQQAVDAAEVDERAVLGDVLDHAVDDRAFMQRGQQFAALFTHRGFDHSAARQHDVVALAVELDDLELHRLAFERRHVLDRARIEQRARQERADAVDQNGQAALDLAVDGAGDELARFQRVLQRQPRGQALRLVARQDGVAVAVLDRVDRDRDEIAGLNFELALVVLEFFDRNVGFRLEAGVHDHEAVFDAHHFGSDDLAAAHFGARQRLLEHRGEGFHAGVGVLGLGHWGSGAAELRVRLNNRLAGASSEGRTQKGAKRTAGLAAGPGRRGRLSACRKVVVLPRLSIPHRPIRRPSASSCPGASRLRRASRARRSGFDPVRHAPPALREDYRV